MISLEIRCMWYNIFGYFIQCLGHPRNWEKTKKIHPNFKWVETKKMHPIQQNTHHVWCKVSIEQQSWMRKHIKLRYLKNTFYSFFVKNQGNMSVASANQLFHIKGYQWLGNIVAASSSSTSLKLEKIWNIILSWCNGDIVLNFY